MGKIGTFFRGVKSELKKVRWLTWKELFKYTGIVLGAVFFLTVFIYASDTLISYIMGLILNKLN